MKSSRIASVIRPVIAALMLLPALYGDFGERIHFEIKYTARVVNIPAGARNVRIWIPYPKADRHQIIYSIKTLAAYPTYMREEAQYGNRFVYLEIENPAEDEIIVGLDILASRKREIHNVDFETVTELDEATRSRFQHYLVNNLDTETQARVATIVRENIDPQARYIDKVRAIYDYVYDNMDYGKDLPGYGQGDVGRACRVGSGNCIDFHSLFVSIAREAGVIATEVANIDLPFEEGVPNYCNASYHCNVEVYLPGHGWFPMDISHAKKGKGSKEFYFGSLDNLRLRLGQGRDLLLAPAQAAGRVDRLLHRPYVEIDGAVHPDVEVSVQAMLFDRSNIVERQPHLVSAGQAAKAFQWIDLNGNNFNLADYLGKKNIAINFFSSWCGRCNWETKGLNRASAEFDFIFIRINLMEPLDKVEQFVQRYRIPYTVLPDEKGRLAQLYGVKYVPTNIIIDQEGIIRFAGGLLTEEDLRRRLKEIGGLEGML